jgi:hypothetical protein
MLGLRAAGLRAAGCFRPTDLDASFLGAVVFAGTPRAAGFLTAEFLEGGVFAFTVLETAFRAVSFLVVAVPVPLTFLDVVDFRVAATAWVATFAAPRFGLAAVARAVFGFAIRAGVAFGRTTFTSPRIARPGDRAFATAFTVGRRVGLLREVEAMGTTLVTVATWETMPVARYTRTTMGATATSGYRRVARRSSPGRLKPVHRAAPQLKW